MATTIKFSLLLFCCISLSPFREITQPAQPTEGCGGTTYAYEEVKISNFAKKAGGFFIFEPQTPLLDNLSRDSIGRAPVIIFLHGYSAYNPMVYGNWINHLVRKGNIVIFPRYQKNVFAPRPKKFIQNVINSIKGGWEELQKEGHVPIETTAPVSYIGHSFGGAIIANMSTKWDSIGIPKPEAAMLVSPGTGPFDKFILDDYSSIPSDTKMLITVSENDEVVGSRMGKKIFNTATNTLSRNLLIQHADDYGSQKISAHHREVYAQNKQFDSGKHGYSYRRALRSRTDVVDYNGYWKLFDALQNCTLSESDCDVAFGNTDAQRSLGKWSDGTPIKPLTVILPSKN